MCTTMKYEAYVLNDKLAAVSDELLHSKGNGGDGSNSPESPKRHTPYWYMDDNDTTADDDMTQQHHRRIECLEQAL